MDELHILTNLLLISSAINLLIIVLYFLEKSFNRELEKSLQAATANSERFLKVADDLQFRLRCKVQHRQKLSRRTIPNLKSVPKEDD